MSYISPNFGKGYIEIMKKAYRAAHPEEIEKITEAEPIIDEAPIENLTETEEANIISVVEEAMAEPVKEEPVIVTESEPAVEETVAEVIVAPSEKPAVETVAEETVKAAPKKTSKKSKASKN